MAYTFPIDPFPVRAPSETNRYEVRRFYEFLPEKMRKIKNEEKEFFDEESCTYPNLKIEDIKTEWITFLCHEEILTQGDIDEHVATSHGFEMGEIKDEYRIQRNKISNLVLREAMDLRTQSEHSMDRLMESWYESAVANNILFNDNGSQAAVVNCLSRPPSVSGNTVPFLHGIHVPNALRHELIPFCLHRLLRLLISLQFFAPDWSCDASTK